jgi:hypothetical protein
MSNSPNLHQTCYHRLVIFMQYLQHGFSVLACEPYVQILPLSTTCQCQFRHYANPRHNDQIFMTCCIAQIHRAFDSGRLDANYCRNFGTKLRWDHSGFTEFRWDHSVQLGLHWCFCFWVVSCLLPGGVPKHCPRRQLQMGEDSHQAKRDSEPINFINLLRKYPSLTRNTARNAARALSRAARALPGYVFCASPGTRPSDSAVWLH